MTDTEFKNKILQILKANFIRSESAEKIAAEISELIPKDIPEEEPKEPNPIQKKENLIHDLGCEIQHTGECNCKEKGYKQYKIDEKIEGEVSAKRIPF